MSHSLWSRGQTEPFAAIIAIGLLVVGLGIYAIAVHPLLPGTSDSTTADQTIDRIWTDISDDGIFYAHADPDLEAHITADSLPAGSTVAVTVTAIEGGQERAVADAGLPAGHPTETTAHDIYEVERYLDEEGIPTGASVATRSVPVAVTNRADVRSGTLEVAVW